MKKTLILMIAASMLFSCQKKDIEPSAITEQEVVFNATEIFPEAGLKSTDLWGCNDLSIDYAKMKIGDDFYYAEVMRVNGILYTQSLKLPVPPEGSKTYTLNEFFLMHDFGDKGPGQEDSIVMATPSTEGPYKQYVKDPVSMQFSVNAFDKSEIPIDVLCFNASEIEGFGFEWFQVTEIVVREFCFFGDICLNGEYPDPNILNDYVGSMYDELQLPTGVQMDMPAIFKIHAYRTYNDITEELPDSPVTNASADYGYGEGYPLCVEYPDRLTVSGEVFTFALWVWVKNNAGGFSYQYYGSFLSTDDGPLYRGITTVPAVGPEGIVDFAIGDCSPWSTNIYNWLPAPLPLK